MNQLLDKTRRLRILFLSIVLATYGPVPVAVLANQGAQSLEPALDEFFQRQGRSWTVQRDDRRTVTSLLGRGTVAYRGEPTENASQFLRENHRLFGLTPTLNGLRLIAGKTGAFGSHVEFQQILKGLPVENGRIQVNFDKERRVVYVVSSIAPTARALDKTTISKAQAIRNAIDQFLRTTLHNPSKNVPPRITTDPLRPNVPQLITRNQLQLNQPPKVDDVFFANQRLRRAYRILINAARPFGIKEFVTDANNGEILQTRDFVFNATDGQGQVFIPNPVNSLNDTTLLDNGDEDTAVTSANPNPYYTVSLPALDGTGPFMLSGPFVVLEDIESPPNTLPSEMNANGFNYLRKADSFEDVMVYYHVDRMQRYIQSLGFLNALNRCLRADAHGVFEADNSRYVRNDANPADSYIAFGDGGVDDAEDADVIAHEYGHALQDDQAPEKYSTSGYPRAMGEGFGDYWATSSYAEVNENSTHSLPCVMEWDSVPLPCRRRVDEPLTANNFNPAANDYDNGQIWSTTLYDIFTNIDKTTADKLILQSHFNVPHSPTFKQGADAIVAADVQMFSGVHVPLLCAIFKSRRIYNDSDCLGVPLKTPIIPHVSWFSTSGPNKFGFNANFEVPVIVAEPNE